MKLPRFTSGNFGRLEFAHLNEAFDRIEESFARIAVRSRVEDESTLIVQLTAVRSVAVSDNQFVNEYAWKEIERNEIGDFVLKTSGLTSGHSDDPYLSPAVQMQRTGTPIDVVEVGDYVALAPRTASDGSRYLVILRSLTSKSGLLQISGASQIVSATGGTKPIWRYSARRVRIRQMNVGQPIPLPYIEYLPPPNDAPTVLFNSAEFVDDGGDGTFGVGFIPIGTPEYRLPLKNGLVVSATLSPDVQQQIGVNIGWVCCVPNGYKYRCAQNP